MRIKSVELKNIRSYEKEFVEFPEGSVLLSGDVGSGKSSLLLAIEFALFGIKRGELSGEALLRRGKKSGTVRLNFTLDGRDITIERNLGRTSSGVRQESGYITIDGMKREGTATELKARVLELLGYPQELVQKQKSLLYRYTVYTPQEQMKQIIKVDREKRLDTLRKLFGVDRYKIIRGNIEEFLRGVRAKKRELKIVFRGLEEKKEKIKAEKKKLNDVKKLLEKLKHEENGIQKELEKWKKKKKHIEEKIKLFNKYDKERGKAKTNRGNIEQQLSSVTTEIQKKGSNIKQLEKLKPPTELPDKELKKLIDAFDQDREEFLKDPHGMDQQTDTLLKRKENLETRIEETKKSRTKAKTRIETLNESIQKLVEAKDVCPVCGQKLDEEHRQEKINEYKKDISEKEEKKKKLRSELKTLKQDLEEAKEQIKENVAQRIQEIKTRIEKLEQKREELRKYHEDMKEKKRLNDEVIKDEKKKKQLEKDLADTIDKIKNFTQKLEKLKGVEEQKDQIEGQIDKISSQLTDVKGRIVRNQTLKDTTKGQLAELEKETKKMETAKNFEKKLGGYESWFENYLIELAGTIERHFMLELKNRFNPLFRDWFNLLIEDELLNVRINDTFTPIIEQEGYEAEYENLSGGESASVALAYRLALNKVINTLIEEIKSNDIIILDEPTDGFSNDQLDKIRDIISELNIPQTIIVSHEPKVESYVENIIRVDKERGISKVLEA
ncbi:MAG: SMC family ATPase [Thermoproteota archaeon]|nr:SMC family ATPase [Thermoproteota archaeon]